MFEIAVDYLFPVLFLTGFAAGTIDAIAGGGGLITVPVLLGLGIPPHIALGTNKLQSVFGTAMATYSYHKQGWLNTQGLLRGLIYSFIGAVIGAIASQFTEGDILKKVIPVILLLVLLYTIFTPKLGMVDNNAKMNKNLFYAIFGSLLGFYDGFLGPGTGSFWVFVLVYFLGQNLVKATAYTKAFNLNTNITALICFALGNNIDYKIGLCMAAGQIIGGKWGAHLAIKKGVRLIRPIFITVVTLTIATLIYKNYAEYDTIKTFFQDANILFLGMMAVVSVFGIIFLRYVRKRMRARL
jgi:uncharacterized protein